MARSGRYIAISCAVMLIASTAIAEVDRDAMRRVIDSTVYIKAERVFSGTELPSGGTGFFIGPDGFLLTNAHVVADTIEAPLLGEMREVNAAVRDLRVVIGSGTEQEQLPAKVVASDQDHDLALLRVRYRPGTWLEVDGGTGFDLLDPVWIVGFPFGELLAVGNRAGSGRKRNPTASVHSGMITALRHDDDGRLAFLQTDASVNPGNSGGPMVTASGRFAGVVVARIHGSDGVGFSIAPEVVRDFLDKASIRVAVTPREILDPPQPLMIRVEPVMTSTPVGDATALFSGEGIEPLRVRLKQEGGMWTGVVDPPFETAAADSYILRVELWSEKGRRILRRSFRLRATHRPVEPVGSASGAADAMGDRAVVRNEVSTAFGWQRPGEQGRQSLAQVAGEVKISGSASVITNETVGKSPDAGFDERRYSSLYGEELKEVARAVDDRMAELDVHLEEKTRLQRSLQRNERRDQLQRHLERLEGILAVDKRRLKDALDAARQAGLCVCEDRYWHQCGGPCSASTSMVDLWKEAR